jgi:hypothetical protein
MNVNRERGFDDAVIRVPVTGCVTEWNCLTSTRYGIEAKRVGKAMEFRTDFPACGERVYVITRQRPADVAPKPRYTQKQTQMCAGPFAYSLDEKNICVLDLARYRIDEGRWQDAREVLKIDQAVRDHFGLARRGGEMVQPWFSRKYWPRPKVKGQVTLAFPFRVETVPPGPVALCIEHPEHFKIELNGRAVSSEADGWWIDPAIEKVALPQQALVKGDNTLELQMAFSEDKSIEAIYLIGEFGVRVAGTEKTLTGLPGRLAVGDVTSQGLPFYSGTIRYEIPVRYQPQADEYAFIELPGFEGACAKVSSEGRAPRMIAWQPYEAEITEDLRAAGTIFVDVVLTRRNTFGPLHLVPKRSGAYGPGHWITGGKQWSDEYQLWEAGLLSPPRLRIATSE